MTVTGARTRSPRKRPRHGGATRVTIADVARIAQVSAMTVSRVINFDTAVAEPTRARVKAAIGTLGYVPNPAARSLAGVRQLRVALLHTNPSAAYLSEFLVGCLDQANADDTILVVEPHDPPETASALAARLVSHRIDGAILPPPLCDQPAIIGALVASGIRVAQVATGAPRAGLAAVTIDDRRAAEAMTRHLITLGHRRIGFITGARDQTASAQRLDGYRAALAAAGFAPDPMLVTGGDFTYRSGLAAASTLLSAANPPTAIFASNDDMAAAVVATAHRFGLDVPRDLSVAGFDDTAMATAIWPELTTIRQPVAAMARAAMVLTIEALRRGDDGGAARELAFELVLRGSTGRCTSATR